MKKETEKTKQKQQRKNVMLNQSRIDKLIEIGNGNLSVGIRTASDSYKIKK